MPVKVPMTSGAGVKVFHGWADGSITLAEQAETRSRGSRNVRGGIVDVVLDFMHYAT
jgi:hypothetical protein